MPKRKGKTPWQQFWKEREQSHLRVISLIQRQQLEEKQELFRSLNSPLNPNFKFYDSWTFLHFAVLAGSIGSVKVLLKSGSDVSSKTSSGNTALHFAIKLDYYQLAELLLANGAAVNETDDQLCTPLHLAVKSDNDSLVQLLLRHGAVEAEDLEGKKPSAYSTSQQVKDLLREEARFYMSDVRKPLACRLQNLELYEELDRGSFGQVYLARLIGGEELLAVKLIDKRRYRKLEKLLVCERNVMRKFRNPFIIRLKFAFQNDQYFFLGMKYCPGGTLKELLEAGPLPEGLARVYAAEILHGLSVLHRSDVIYRDLKPGNIVFDQRGHIVIIDFGVAKDNFQEGEMTKERLGTLNYAAYQVFAKTGYTKVADWFSYGVVVYELLVGRNPFNAVSIEDYQAKVQALRLNFPKQVSIEAREFVASLLSADQSSRLGAKGSCEIQAHPFFAGLDWQRIAARKYEVPVRQSRQGIPKVLKCRRKFSISECSNRLTDWTFVSDSFNCM